MLLTIGVTRGLSQVRWPQILLRCERINMPDNLIGDSRLPLCYPHFRAVSPSFHTVRTPPSCSIRANLSDDLVRLECCVCIELIRGRSVSDPSTSMSVSLHHLSAHR